jgi:hypothetical protein
LAALQVVLRWSESRPGWKLDYVHLKRSTPGLRMDVRR